MSEHVVKERIGLPIWDGDFVRDTRHFNPGDTITSADFEEARQDKEERQMLIENNCYTAAELREKE